MQFGPTAFRLLHEIVRADPALGPVAMAKVDIRDAYMRVRIRLADIPKLAFVIPPVPGDAEPLIGFHLFLPMGYVESCPFFCIFPENITDLANAWEGNALQPHKLENLANTPPAIDNECFLAKDNFLL